MINNKQYYLSIIEQIIDSQQRSLNNYANKPNANQNFINDKNDEIALLIDVFNFFSDDDLSAFWADAEEIIKNLKVKDPEIGIIKISILIDRTKNQLAIIDFT